MTRADINLPARSAPGGVSPVRRALAAPFDTPPASCRVSAHSSLSLVLCFGNTRAATGDRPSADEGARRAGPGDQVRRPRHRRGARPARRKAAVSVRHASRRLRRARAGDRPASTRCASRSTASSSPTTSTASRNSMRCVRAASSVSTSATCPPAPTRSTCTSRQGEGGADYSHTGQFSFNKGVEPQLVGLTLAGPGSGRAPIELGNW